MIPSAHRLVFRAAPKILLKAPGTHVSCSAIPLASSFATGLKIVATQAPRALGYVYPKALFTSSSASFNASAVTPIRNTTKNTPHSAILPDGKIQVQTPDVDDLVKFTHRLMRDFVQRTPLPPSKDYVTLSFYQFRPIDEMDVAKIQYYFLTDLRAMDVVGRIYVSTEGINAQISCPKDRVDKFKDYYSEHWPIFDKIRFNPAMSEGRAFKKLHVRAKQQLVSDGIDNSTFDLNNEPTYLTPEQWHKELSSLSQPPILIDMRNHYESAIGHFENAVRPDVTTFRENVDAMLEICEGKEDQDIYMYCTGGIRCTRSGALLKSKGYNSVKMLQGGVTAYGKYIQEQRAMSSDNKSNDGGEGTAAAADKQIKSIYKGKNFTFDKRLGEPITDDVLAKCHSCGAPCDAYCNCTNTACNLLMISCPSCRVQHEGTCGSHTCLDIVKELQLKQERIKEEYPHLIGMKARPGIKPFYNHSMRVRPSKVMEARKSKAHQSP